MKTRSILALALALAFAAIGVPTAMAAGAGAADPGASAAPEGGGSLSVDSWTNGLFGTLNAAEDGCSGDRRLVIYERQGDGRDPSGDRQVDVTRTAKGEEAGDWSIRGGVGDPGRYYADAPATQNCAEAMSAAVRPDLGDDRGASGKGLRICGSRDAREPFPKQLDECFFASRVSIASCFEQHLYNNPYVQCLDPTGVPCFCKTTFAWEINRGGDPITRVVVSSYVEPFIGITAVSRGEELALYAVDVKAGSYTNIYPPQGEPGKAGGPLVLRESPDGKYVSLEGIVYKK